MITATQNLNRIVPLIAVAALIFASLAGSPAVAQEATSPVMDLGFATLTVPPGEGWIVEDDSQGMLFAQRRLSDTHTLVAGARYSVGFSNETAFLLRSQPMMLLEARREEIFQQLNDGRFPVSDFQEFAWDGDVATCLGYRVEAADRQVRSEAGQMFPFRAVGLLCVFTEYPAYVEYDFSERRDPGEQPYSGFEEDAQDFLASLAAN